MSSFYVYIVVIHVLCDQVACTGPPPNLFRIFAARTSCVRICYESLCDELEGARPLPINSTYLCKCCTDMLCATKWHAQGLSQQAPNISARTSCVRLCYEPLCN